MSGGLNVDRRTVLAGIGGATAVALGGAYLLTSRGWRTVDTPVDVDLNALARSAAGAVAVGGGGTVLVRREDGWTTQVDDGPAGNGRNLLGADATTDRERVWVVGASGAVGRFDPTSGAIADRSAPNDATDNFRDVAVTGPAGDANVYVTGDAGTIHYSVEGGAAGTWSSVTPGSGASLPAIDLHAARRGHAVDTDGAVWATDDGETWSAIGVEDADANYYGVDGNAAAVTVVGGDGTVLRHDGSWSRTDLGDASLQAVELLKGSGIAVGNGGSLFARRDGEWQREETPTGANLSAVSLGAPTIAAGDGGTVIELRS